MLTCRLLTPAILNVLLASHHDCTYCESFKRLSNDRLGPSYATFLRTCDTNRATAIIFTDAPRSLTDGISGSMQFAGDTFRAEQIEEGGVSFVRNIGTGLPVCMVSQPSITLCYY